MNPNCKSHFSRSTFWMMMTLWNLVTCRYLKKPSMAWLLLIFPTLQPSVCSFDSSSNNLQYPAAPWIHGIVSPCATKLNNVSEAMVWPSYLGSPTLFHSNTFTSFCKTSFSLSTLLTSFSHSAAVQKRWSPPLTFSFFCHQHNLVDFYWRPHPLCCHYWFTALSFLLCYNLSEDKIPVTLAPGIGHVF